MSRRREHILAGALLFAVILAVYADKIFGHGRIFTELIQDITNIYGFYQWDAFSSFELKAGRFPLWNPHNGLGVPHLANMQSAIFFPLNWPKFVFGFWKVIDWILLARLWTAGFFLYLFARRALALKPLPAFFAGLSFALCGYFLRYVYMSHLNVECLIPLQLVLFHRLAQTGKFSAWAGSVCSVFLVIAGGFPEASLYALVFSAAYFVFGVRGAAGLKARLAILASVLVFGALLAAAQWLPFYEYLGRAWTYHQESAGGRHLDPAYAVSLLLPWFFGKNLESTLVPFLAPGIGTVALILALRGALSGRSEFRRAAFWLAGAVVLAGLIFGAPPFIWLGRVFPFNLTYNYKYAMPALSLCGSVLAGIGLEKFLGQDRMPLDLAAIGAVWTWATADLIAALLNGFQPFYGFGIKIEMARLLAVSAALLLALSLRRLRLVRVSAAVVLAATIGSIFFDYRCNRGVDRGEFLLAQTEESRLIGKVSAEPFRYCAEGDILFPNLLLAAGVDDLRSYDPLYPESYVYFMAAINGLATDRSIEERYNRDKTFTVDRYHLKSSLVPLANLMLYSADHELDSMPAADRLLEAGKQTGDFPGWARSQIVELGDAAKKSLVMHANGSLDAELALEYRPWALHFDAAVAPVRQEFTGDGAQLQAMADENGSRRLLYSRFLRPGSRAEEQRFFPVEIKLAVPGEKIRLRLTGLSGPAGNSAGDYAAWAGLRFRSPQFKVEARNLTEDGEIGLNRLADVFPRYFLAPGFGALGASGLGDEFQKFSALNSVQAGYFRAQAVLPAPASFPATGRRLAGGSGVKVISSSPGRVQLELRADTDGFLVASEQYFPGWRAALDGHEQRVYRADLALRCLFIPAGEHVVQFRYEPYSFKTGLWLLLAGILSGGVAFWARSKKQG